MLQKMSIGLKLMTLGMNPNKLDSGDIGIKASPLAPTSGLIFSMQCVGWGEFTSPNVILIEE